MKALLINPFTDAFKGTGFGLNAEARFRMAGRRAHNGGGGKVGSPNGEERQWQGREQGCGATASGCGAGRVRE